MADTDRRPTTSAQLKSDIDAGRSGERSGGFDPAAAPIGTDSEAAAAPPSAAETARSEPQARSSATKNAAEPELAPDARMNTSGPVAAGFAVGAAVAVVFSGFLWLAVR